MKLLALLVKMSYFCREMKLKQRLFKYSTKPIVVIGMFLVSTFIFTLMGTSIASAAFYNNEAHCNNNNGVWWENRCYIMDKDGKAKCTKADGEWHSVSLANGGAPYVVTLTLADPAGYCNGPDSQDAPPGPAECEGNIDAITGECVEERFCKKYANQARKDACIKGYTEGSSACEGMGDAERQACEDGAQNGVNPDPDSSGGGVATPGGCGDGLETAIIPCNGIWGLVELVINILTAGVGLVAIGGIMYGGFLYATAGDKSDQVTKGVHTIVNVVIGVVAYFLLYGFLQFLIPGGVFS